MHIYVCRVDPDALKKGPIHRRFVYKEDTSTHAHTHTEYIHTCEHTCVWHMLYSVAAEQEASVFKYAVNYLKTYLCLYI